jgi:hypothetical protein
VHAEKCLNAEDKPLQIQKEKNVPYFTFKETPDINAYNQLMAIFANLKNAPNKYTSILRSQQVRSSFPSSHVTAAGTGTVTVPGIATDTVIGTGTIKDTGRSTITGTGTGTGTGAVSAANAAPVQLKDPNMCRRTYAR